MAETKYGKYVITNPLISSGEEVEAYHRTDDKANRQHRVFLNDELIPGVSVYCNVMWITGNDDSGEVEPHTHDFDGYKLWVAPGGPDDKLPADIEIGLGKSGEEPEMHAFNRTTLVYVPAGMSLGPLYVKNWDGSRPILRIAVGLAPRRKEGDAHF